MLHKIKLVEQQAMSRSSKADNYKYPALKRPCCGKRVDSNAPSQIMG
jgi:hypothetical protein